jgi:hypothetical protein
MFEVDFKCCFSACLLSLCRGLCFLSKGVLYVDRLVFCGSLFAV